MELYTVRRSGTFIATPVGDNHCGVGENVFRYECSVTVATLDKQGFVIDNQQIADCTVFNNEMKLSCELAAKAIADKVRERMGRRLIRKIKVTVGVRDFADATYEWER